MVEAGLRGLSRLLSAREAETPFGRGGSATALNTAQMPRFHDAVTQRRECDEQRAR